MTDRITEIRSRYGDRRSNVYLKDIQTLLAELDKRNAETGRLVAALLWIDTYDPEIVAAAEEKFGFKLRESKP